MVLWLCSVFGSKARLAGNGEPLTRAATQNPATLQRPRRAGDSRTLSGVGVLAKGDRHCLRTPPGQRTRMAPQSTMGIDQFFTRRLLLAGLCMALLALGSGCATRPPDRVENICDIFDHQPRWYDYAKESEERWGTPIATQIAFVRQESTFRHNARPPRTRLFGFIPWRRPSSAYGYAQAQDPVWGEYMDEEGSLFARRTHMKYALDFIGWYNHRTHQRLGISKQNPEHLYLAYHEGHTGYRRGHWQNRPTVQRSAARVNRFANEYNSQLPACEADLRCRRFWQVGPFCDS